MRVCGREVEAEAGGRGGGVMEIRDRGGGKRIRGGVRRQVDRAAADGACARDIVIQSADTVDEEIQRKVSSSRESVCGLVA